MYERHIAPRLVEALSDTPVVLLHGARQAGKSTLLGLLCEPLGARYVTLDDPSVHAIVSDDPTGFLDRFGGPLIIDEAQLVPGLFRAIKAAVDRDRRPGRFILSGSANVLLLPRVAEALVGRVEVLTLWPLSQGELAGLRGAGVDAWWSGAGPAAQAQFIDRVQAAEAMLIGGYPEAVSRPTARRRASWFDSYLTTIVQRDVHDLANIQGLTEVPRLLSLLAGRSAMLANAAELARACGLPQTTLKRYLSLLQTTFLLQTVPAWSTNFTKRLTRSPKQMLCDVGLAAHLLGIATSAALADHALFGALLESWVAMEVTKQLTWSETPARLHHFRTAEGHEVDLVLEQRDGSVLGIEVKASASVDKRDLRGLRLLRDELGGRFRAGIVVHLGRETLPLGDRLWAAPLAALWS